MRPGLLLGALFLPLLFRCAAAEFSLAGTVVNRITGAPIRRARVSLVGTNNQALSDASGVFRFSHLPADTYLVGVQKIGFDEENPTPLELTESRANLTIPLTPLASIHGRVTDSEGDPVEGVVVVALISQVEHGLASWQLARQATTDDRGQYTIPLLRAGRYLVQAAGRDDHRVIGESTPGRNTHEAFARVYFGGARERALASVLVLSPGQEERADLSLSLQHGYTVSGKITNLKPYSQPAMQLLAGEEDSGWTSSSLQLATGYFELHNVLDGAYRLRIVGAGPGNQPVTGEQEIRVAGGDVEGVSIALGAGITVRGRVHLEGPSTDTAPEALGAFGARLDPPASLRSIAPPSFVSSAADGTFETGRLIPGKYRMQFWTTGPLYVSSVRSGDQDLLADPELVARADTSEIEVVLRADAGFIEGGFVPAAPGREDPACFLLAHESLNRPVEAFCTENGTITLSPLAPGSYRLHGFKGMEALQSIAYRSPEVMHALARSGVRVEVRSGVTTQVRLHTPAEVPK